MTTAEKVKNKLPITHEEFQELVRKTDWSDYIKRVANRIAKVAEAHEQARLMSWKAISRCG